MNEHPMVYVATYHYCTEEEEGTDILGVYWSQEQARAVIKEGLASKRAGLEEDGYTFDEDFEQNDPDYISFGCYATGLGMDESWSGAVEGYKVE